MENSVCQGERNKLQQAAGANLKEARARGEEVCARNKTATETKGVASSELLKQGREMSSEGMLLQRTIAKKASTMDGDRHQ